MPTTSWRNPAFASSSGPAGSAVWANTSNVFTSNNQYSTTASFTSSTDPTNSISCYQFGFAAEVPEGSLIEGVEVSIDRRASGAGVFDNRVLIAAAGAASASKASSVQWPTTDAVAYYGAPDDTWGLALTRDSITQGSLGLGMLIDLRSNTSTGRTGSIDHVQMRVTWREPKIKNYYVRHNGIWKAVDVHYVHHNGVWKDGQQWVKHNGIWKKVYGT